MNTATHDVKDGNRSATLLRQGTGRVDALQAVTAGTTVRSVENDQLVTASFGVVEVAGTTSESRTLRIDEHRRQGAHVQRGVPAAGVAAGRDVRARLEAGHGRPQRHRVGHAHVHDRRPDEAPPRHRPHPGVGAAGLPARVRRSRLRHRGVHADRQLASTRCASAAYVAPKPVSAVQGADHVTFTGPGRSAELTLKGRTLDQGGLTTGYHAAVAPFVLGGTDPAESFPDGSAKRSLQAADVRSYGARTTRRRAPWRSACRRPVRTPTPAP